MEHSTRCNWPVWLKWYMHRNLTGHLSLTTPTTFDVWSAASGLLSLSSCLLKHIVGKIASTSLHDRSVVFATFVDGDIFSGRRAWLTSCWLAILPRPSLRHQRDLVRCLYLRLLKNTLVPQTSSSIHPLRNPVLRQNGQTVSWFLLPL